MVNKFFFIFLLLILSCQGTSKLTKNDALVQVKLENATFTNNRIFFNITDSSGNRVQFYTDTGGGKIIYPETAPKLGLSIDTLQEGDRIMETVNLAPLFEEKNLPPPVGVQFVYRGNHAFEESTDGMLGANWFANKIWNFDYQNETLYWIQDLNWKAFDKQHTVSVGFMKNEQGVSLTHFPRIPIVVEGDTIQTLFDTGATAVLSDSAKQRLGDHYAIGASFIVASVFDKWKVQYPDWEVIKGGDVLLKEDMIKVPQVVIGGYTVGPVWFARRKDKNFTEFMSQWMDQTVYGAVGGSCFQYFSSILIDYPKGLAYFEK